MFLLAFSSAPAFRFAAASHTQTIHNNKSCCFSPFKVRPVATATTAEPSSMSAPQKPSQLRGIFFDLDGTDTLLELVPHFNNGQPITRELYDTQMAGRQNPELVASILPDMPLDERTTLWQTKETRYENVIMKGVPPILGLVSLLNTCQRLNLVHFVVTNAPKGSCYKTLNSIGIKRYFDESRIVVAEECEFPKPNPAPYLKALELSGLKSDQVIVFEDSPSGITAAVTAGICTIGVKSTQTNESLLNAGASFTIDNYEDVKLESFLNRYL